MNAAAMGMVPELRLPWDASQLDEARYRRILRSALAVFLILAVVVPLLPFPELTRSPSLWLITLNRRVMSPRLQVF